MALAITSLLRAGQFLAWKHYYKPEYAKRWLLYFRMSITSTSIVWAIGGIILSTGVNMGHMVYVSFALAGLCAGASSTLAIDRISLICFMLPIQILQIIFHIHNGDTISLGMGALWALFLIFLLATARQIRLKLEESYYLREKASKSESRLLRILESSPIATRITVDNNNKVVFANSRFRELLELTPEQATDISSANFYADPEKYSEVIERLSKGENIVGMQVELRSPGENLWVKWVLASYFTIEYYNKSAVLGWFYDITERKLMEDKAQHLANHDILTGLPNRMLWHSLLQQMLASAKRDKSILAVMFLDLDKFKPVNDHHGHNIGDRLLKAVADRILRCLRESDSAARIGGDEFVVLLPKIKNEENALMIAEKIRHALNQDFDIDDLSLNISSSIGIAIYPNHADSDKELTKRADIAMYYAKSEGRNKVLAYRPDMKH